LVLCSVRDVSGVLRRMYSLLRPGGQLRYLEHVASAGPRGRLQRVADATLWPRLFGNCHTHRDTERSIVDAGFEVDTSRREWTLPVWARLPVWELALGGARRLKFLRGDCAQRVRRRANRDLCAGSARKDYLS